MFFGSSRDIRISAKEVEKLLSRLFFYPKTARREDDTMKYKHLCMKIAHFRKSVRRRRNWFITKAEIYQTEELG